MSFLDLIKFALSNIWAQKLRTILTLLAITVGAFLVFLLPSFGLGVANQIRSQFDSEDLKNITVNPKYEDVKLDFTSTEIPEQKLLKRITVQDVDSIKQTPKVQGIKEVKTSLRPTKIHFDSVNKDIKTETDQLSSRGSSTNFFVPATAFQSVTPGLSIDDYKLELIAGRFLTASDDKESNIVINKTIVDGLKIEKPENLVGKTVTLTFLQNLQSDTDFNKSIVKQYKFTVIGIVKSKDTSSFSGSDMTPTITLPFNKTWEITQWQESGNKDFLNTYTIDSIDVVAKENNQVESLSSDLKNLGYETYSSLDSIKSFQSGVNIALAVLASFGLIALFVGALNIINTLMMSVTERTKEIGILRALGASRATIRRVFLLESAVIALLGGLVGVIAGWIASLILNFILIHQLSASAGDASSLVPHSFFDYSPLLILGVLAFITLIGLLAGIAPAIRASRLNVVDSLRYE
jgi:putative ABC transport system permease protein